jgi:hypothetical protein
MKTKIAYGLRGNGKPALPELTFNSYADFGLGWSDSIQKSIHTPYTKLQKSSGLSDSMYKKKPRLHNVNGVFMELVNGLEPPTG